MDCPKWDQNEVLKLAIGNNGHEQQIEGNGTDEILRGGKINIQVPVLIKNDIQTNFDVNLMQDSHHNLSIFNKRINLVEEIYPQDKDYTWDFNNLKITQGCHKTILAAIIGLKNYDMYQQTNLIQNIIYPLQKNPKSDEYFVKIFINGAFRRVAVTHKFDVSNQNRLSLKGSSLTSYFEDIQRFKQKNYIFPTIIEKALKNIYFGENKLMCSENANIQIQDNQVNRQDINGLNTNNYLYSMSKKKSNNEFDSQNEQ